MLLAELLTSYEVEILNLGPSDWSMMKNKRLLGLAGDEAIQVSNLSLFIYSLSLTYRIFYGPGP